MSIKLSNTTQTIFDFNLPYPIPVPDGIYTIRLGERSVTITINRIQRKKIQGFAGSGTIQIKFDKYGWACYSKISLIFPWIVNLEEEGRKPLLLEEGLKRLKAKELVLKTVNQFIEMVRYFTKEYWVESARYQDILSYDVYYLDQGKKHLVMKVMLDTGVGGIGIGNVHPFQMEQKKLENFKKFLETETELDTSHILILNAKDACLQEDFRLATIEAVSALEILLSKFIKEQGEQVGISPGQIKDFIKTVGITGNIDVVLKLLTKGLKQIDDEIVYICKGAITTRNNILHRGLREVYSTDTEKRLIAIENMLNYIRELMVIDIL